MEKWREEQIEEGAAPRPALFGAVVLEMMRERGLADASELGLARLDLRALRRHLDGDRALHRRWLCARVAEALDATGRDAVRMSLAWMGWDHVDLEETALGTGPAVR